MKRCLLLFWFFSLVASATTQNGAIDAPGDIAILAFNAQAVGNSTNAGITFLLLDDCPHNTAIYFNDEEWRGSSFATSNWEGQIIWKNLTGYSIPRGTVIKLQINSAAGYQNIYANIGTAVNDDRYYLFDSDTYTQLMASTGDRNSAGTFLTFWGDTTTGAVLAGTNLIQGSTALIANNQVEGYYTGPSVCNSTQADCLAQIYNYGSWVFTDSTNYPADLPDSFTGTLFTVNHAPVAASFSLSDFYQGTIYTFTTAAFSYSDSDGDPLNFVRITSAPTQGSLWLDADGSGTINNSESALVNGSVVSKSDLDAGRLKYLNSNGLSDSFTFQVNDGTVDSATYTATLAVIAYPVITLAVTSSSVSESLYSSTVSVTASHTFNQAVTVNLSYSGTATKGIDYTAPDSLIIPAGFTTTSATMSIINDAQEESAETIIIDMASVVNGTESGTQQQTITITDDDQSRPTVVIATTSTAVNGPFTATFTFSENVSGFSASDIVAFNALISSLSGSGSNYTALITPLAEGSLTLNLAGDVVQDVFGNGNYPSSMASVVYDATPPVLTITAASSVVNVPFTATFTFSENVIGFSSDDILINNASVSSLSGSGSSYTALITPLAEGTVTLGVDKDLVQDAAGNNNLASTPLRVEYDATPPDLTITTANSVVTEPFVVTFTFSENVSGFSSGDITVSNAVLSSLSGSGRSYTAVIAPLGDGTVTLSVGADVVSDAGGNSNRAAQPLSVVFDTLNPVVFISGVTGTVNGPFTAVFTFSENVTGFSLSDIVAANASVSSLSGSGSNYTALITPLAQGTVTLGINSGAVQDVAGHLNLASLLLSVNYQVLNTAGLLAISGLAVEGETLSAVLQDADGINAATLAYQWLSDALPVGTDSASYTIGATDIGHTISVQVSYTDNRGNAELHTSAATARVISQQAHAIDSIAALAGSAANASQLTVVQYRQAGIEWPDDTSLSRILPLLNSAVARSLSTALDEAAELEALVSLIMEAQDDDGDGLPNSLEGTVHTDRDGDGLADRADTDSDQDGMSDRVELGLVLTDSDDDGIIDFFDADADQDGNLDDDRIDDNLDGADDLLMTIAGFSSRQPLADADGDGLLNSQDLDSDNDGVGDVAENSLTDADGNLLIDEPYVVIDDSNQLSDDNNDGIYNFVQLKSDAVQTDLIRAGLPSALDSNHDGRLDSTIDMDSDGLMDVVDNAVGAFGSLPDIDGDGIPNHLDDDDDGDGIPDVTENPQAQYFTGLDADADGIDDGVDYEVNGLISGVDLNGNGVRDDREMPDADHDGIADHLDPDSDNDGVMDGIDPSVNTGVDVTVGAGALSSWMLLLLAGLGVAGRCRSLLAALLLWVPLSQAEDGNSKWLVSWGAGYSLLTPEVAASNRVSSEGSLAGAFALGHQLTDNWQVLLEYGLPGSVEVNRATVDYTTTSLLAQYRQAYDDHWQWKLGTGYVHIDAAKAAGLNARVESSQQVAAQAGVEYRLPDGSWVGLQATRYSGDVHTLMLVFTSYIH